MRNDDTTTHRLTTVTLGLAMIVFGLGLSPFAAPNASAQDEEICERPLDVVFTMDTSYSMNQELPNGSTRWSVAQKGAIGLAGELSESDDTSAVVEFKRGAWVNKTLDYNHVPADDPTSTAGVIQGLTINDWRNGNTWTDAAIETSQQELEDNGRAGVSDVMVLVTDGLPYPSWRSQPAVDAAEAAKQAGTEIFVVGIGGLNDALMEEIASEPADTHYYPADTAEEVEAAYQGIKDNLRRGDVRGESYAVKAHAQAGSGEVSVEKVNQQLLPPSEEGTIETVTATTSNPPLRLEADVAHGVTEGETTQTSASATARATIERLEIVDTASQKKLVEIDTLRAESLSTAYPNWAGSDDGSTALAEASVLNYGTTETVPPNTVIPLPGVGKLVLNEQIQDTGDAHSSLRVNLVHLYLSDPVANEVGTEVVVASAWTGAYCGVTPDATPDEDEGPVEADSPEVDPDTQHCVWLEDVAVLCTPAVEDRVHHEINRTRP